MELLNLIGSVASVFGLLVTFYTLYKVENLTSTLKQRSRDERSLDIADRLDQIPSGRRTLAPSMIREIEALMEAVRLYDVSKLPFRHRKLKSLLGTLEAELKGQKQVEVVRLKFALLRDELTIR